jgi:hypothetical protein
MPYDSTIMDAFSPEFAQQWLAEHGSPSDGRAAGDCDDAASASQREALEELAERVNAARSVY